MEPELGLDRIPEKRVQKQIGCVTGIFQLFGRQQTVLNRKRLNRSQVVQYSSELESSIQSSSVSRDFDEMNLTSVYICPISTKSSDTRNRVPTPEATTPVKSVNTPPSMTAHEFRNMNKSTWKFRESPRLSLDSRATVDGKGGIFPKQIPATRRDEVSEDDGVEKQRKSTSVIARLMGLETLPNYDSDSTTKSMTRPELRRSASESRVHPDLSQYRFIERFDCGQNQSSDVNAKAFESSNCTGFETVVTKKMSEMDRRSQFQQRRSSYDSVDVFPEQKKCGTHYEEIQKKLKTRGINIDEPLMDLETLKHVLEALQLKELLRKTELEINRDECHGWAPESPMPSFSTHSVESQKIARLSVSRLSHGAGRSTQRAEQTVTRNRRMTNSVSRKTEERTSAAAVRSPGWKVKAGNSISPARNKMRADRNDGKQRVPEPSSISSEKIVRDAEGSRFRDKRRIVLDRCDLLLQSIAEFNSSEKLQQNDEHPSPVSVLDSSFYTDDSPSPSPSPVMKRSIVFPDCQVELANESSFPAESSVEHCDFVYIAQIVGLSETDLSEVDMFSHLEDEQIDSSKVYSKLQRRLIFDVVTELIRKHRNLQNCQPFPPSNPPTPKLIWTEFQKIRDQEAGEEDLIELIQSLQRKDLRDDLWSTPREEKTELVVDIERMVFRDLIEDVLRDLAGQSAFESQPLPLCRKLVF